MGGLALGSAVAGRYAGRVTRPVLVYGILEAGIALSALAVPLLLLAARGLYAAILGDQPAPPDAATIGQPIFYLLVAFVVLAIPTGFMGATLRCSSATPCAPMPKSGRGVALLYAINTAGAVCGTVIAAFALLPALGLNRTVWGGRGRQRAGVLHRRGAGPQPARQRPPATRPSRPPAPPRLRHGLHPAVARGAAPLRDRLTTVFRTQARWMLPLMLVSGANAFL